MSRFFFTLHSVAQRNRCRTRKRKIEEQIIESIFEISLQQTMKATASTNKFQSSYWHKVIEKMKKDFEKNFSRKIAWDNVRGSPNDLLNLFSFFPDFSFTQKTEKINLQFCCFWLTGWNVFKLQLAKEKKNKRREKYHSRSGTVSGCNFLRNKHQSWWYIRIGSVQNIRFKKP